MQAIAQPLAIDQCNCFAMRKANRRITRFYDAHLEPTGLRITQFLILAALRELGGAAINALAERLDTERTAMGKMIATLERDGLLKSRPAPEDARSRRVELSAEGRRRFEAALPRWQAAQREFQQLNGARGVSALRGSLEKMAVGELGTVED